MKKSCTVSDLKSFRGADVNELENIANRIKKLGEEKRARGELNAFLDKKQELKLQIYCSGSSVCR